MNVALNRAKTGGKASLPHRRLAQYRRRYRALVTEGMGLHPAPGYGSLRWPHFRRTQHLASVDAYVRLAESEGGSVVTGGQQLRGEGYDGGNFYPPTIITGLSNSSRTCQEEIFGPVLVAMPFDHDDDLINQANDSIYGLACGIWTQDYKRAWSTARRIDAGTAWINTYKLLSSAAPFGGTKQSGLGREKGRTWIREYMTQKSMYWGTNSSPIQWSDL